MNKAYTFQNNLIELPYKILNDWSDISICLWVKISKVGYHSILSGSKDGNNELLIYTDNSELSFIIQDEVIKSSYKMQNDQWAYIVLIRNFS